MDNKELTISFSDEINSLLRSGTSGEFSVEQLNSIHQLKSDETKNLFLSIIELLTKLREYRAFISDLSKGILSSEPPAGNILVSPFKQLQASLLHLTWQVRRLSEGDLNQEIDFLGDFSLYFNKLIESLKEKSQIEEKFKNTAEKYRISIENANIGIMTVDLMGKILTTNKECTNIFGFSQSELESLTVREIAVPEDKMVSSDYIESAIGNKGQAKAEFVKRYISKSGKIITCEVSSSLMYSNNGEPLFFISHIKDISIRVETERAITMLNARLSETVTELKQANAVKDKFSRIIAHDLKNYFNSILGFSEFLVEHVHTDSPEEIQSNASIILQSSQNAYKLLENLSEWSMSQSGQISFNPQNINVENILEQVIDFASAQILTKDITLGYNISGDYLVFADANMLRTILRNLIGNAIKFTRKKGEIKIEVKQNSNEVLFVVSDTGIGIEAEVARSLFLIDNKLKISSDHPGKGTGLGLLLCKEFVAKHEGKIWVESKPGKGSDFKFTLPSKASQ